MRNRPTRGLGDVQPGRLLPWFGWIKKGEEKEAAVVSGKSGNPGMPKDLDHFRIEFNASDPMLSAWADRLGDKPRAIPFVFPYADIDRNQELTNDCYRNEVLVHRCDALQAGERGRLLMALDPQTLKPTVRNGIELETGREAYCDGSLVYRTDNGEYYCELCVRLHITPLGVGKAGTLTVVSRSDIDAKTLRRQLLELVENVKRPDGSYDLRGIPLVLRRVPRTIPWFDDGKGKRFEREMWMLAIEVAPEFGDALVKANVRRAFEMIELEAAPDPVLPPPVGAAQLPMPKAGDARTSEAEQATDRTQPAGKTVKAGASAAGNGQTPDRKALNKAWALMWNTARQLGLDVKAAPGDIDDAGLQQRIVAGKGLIADWYVSIRADLPFDLFAEAPGDLKLAELCELAGRAAKHLKQRQGKRR